MTSSYLGVGGAPGAGGKKPPSGGGGATGGKASTSVYFGTPGIPPVAETSSVYFTPGGNFTAPAAVDNNYFSVPSASGNYFYTF